MAFTVYVERGSDGRTYDWEGGIGALFDDPEVEVTYPESEGPVLRPDDLRGADAYVSRSLRITADSLAGVDSLKIVTRSGAGYDNLDLDALTGHGVVATHAPQGPTKAVAQSTLSLLIACAHNLRAYENRFRAEGFRAARDADIGFNVFGRTVGVIGFGRIGQTVIELLEPFDVDVLAYDPYADEDRAAELGVDVVDRDTLLAEADLVTIHVPRTPETRGMLGAEDFRKMKETAYLVNTSRGGIYPDADLARAVREGWIAGAAIDVFEDEPDVGDNPLLDLEDCIMLPHVTGRTVDTRRRTGELMAESILNVKAGELPINVLNPDVYDEPVPDENLTPSYRGD